MPFCCVVGKSMAVAVIISIPQNQMCVPISLPKLPLQLLSNPPTPSFYRIMHILNKNHGTAKEQHYLAQASVCLFFASETDAQIKEQSKLAFAKLQIKIVQENRRLPSFQVTSCTELWLLQKTEIPIILVQLWPTKPWQSCFQGIDKIIIYTSYIIIIIFSTA